MFQECNIHVAQRLLLYFDTRKKDIFHPNITLQSLHQEALQFGFVSNALS